MFVVIPQGSILGLLIFNISISDSFLLNKTSEICNFALENTKLVDSRVVPGGRRTGGLRLPAKVLEGAPKCLRGIRLLLNKQYLQSYERRNVH